MKTILTLLCIGLLCYLGYWFMYSKALDAQFDDFYQNEYVNKSFHGKLRRIVDYGAHKKVLEIATVQEDFSYGKICTNSEFNSFVSEGDSIYKDTPSDKVIIKKLTGQLDTFKLEFCD